MQIASARLAKRLLSGLQQGQLPQSLRRSSLDAALLSQRTGRGSACGPPASDQSRYTDADAAAASAARVPQGGHGAVQRHPVRLQVGVQDPRHPQPLA